MRVALYSPFFPPQVGGAERFTHVLADFLARGGHQVTVVTLVPLEPDEELRLPYPVIRNPSSVRWVQIARGLRRRSRQRGDWIDASGLCRLT